MPTIDALAIAQTQNPSTSEFSGLTRAELEIELEQLRHRETLLDATERAARIGHYEWNYELDRLESCSKEYASLYNMTVEEVMAAQDSWEKTLQQVLPDDQERYRLSSKALRDNKALDVNYRILLDNGTIKHIREFSVITADENGVERGSFGILQDISDQIRHERDLEYRDDLARQTEAITDIGHFIYDEDNECYVFMSEGCARIFGTTAELYQQNVRSVEADLADIVAEDRNRVAAEYKHYIETGQDCALEFRIKRADGTVRWVRELTRAKLVKDGKVRQTLGVIQDITERVAREQDLMFKDAMASQAEAITDIGYFLFDEIKDQHLFVSPGQARIVGLGVDEYMRKIISNEDYFSLVHQEDREMIRQAYRNVLENHGNWEIEYRVQRPDGDLRWVREVGKAHKRNGTQVEQTIGVLQDITEQKKTEQELLYKDALANQAEAITDIGHFIYDEIKQKYLFVSPGLASIHGMSAEEMITRTISRKGNLQLIHADDQARVQKAYDRFMANRLMEFRSKRLAYCRILPRRKTPSRKSSTPGIRSNSRWSNVPANLQIRSSSYRSKLKNVKKLPPNLIFWPTTMRSLGCQACACVKTALISR
jgi:PAS domain S-box-containing protein